MAAAAAVAPTVKVTGREREPARCRVDGGLSNWLMLSQTEEDGRVAGEIEGKKAGKQPEKGGEGWLGHFAGIPTKKKPSHKSDKDFIIFKISLFDRKSIAVFLEVCVTGAEPSPVQCGSDEDPDGRGASNGD